MKVQRVAMFGGSFDPPHRGHAAIARAAAEAFALDLVLFVPTGRQPLKPEGATAPYADRLAMTSLVCDEDDRFAASAVEAPGQDAVPNYTVNTLARLQHKMPDAELFCLVGADSFHDLARWSSPDRLLNATEWIVISRPGSELADPAGMTLTQEQRARVHLLDTVHEAVSATDLRNRLRHGDSTKGLLAPAVAAYIADHRLYR